MSNQTEPTSTRHYLYYGTMMMCILHMFLFLAMSRTNEYRDLALGVFAFVIAGALRLLWQTKQTLPIEQDMPDWFYPVVTVSWALAGLSWLVFGAAV